MVNRPSPSFLGAQPREEGPGRITSGDLPSLNGRGEEWLALETMLHHASFPRSEYARVMQIMRELVEGHCLLAPIPASVVIWGSARTKPGEPAYRSAFETARELAQAGFGIITGGGPGIMEAGNKGAQEAGAVSVGLPMESLQGEPPNGFLDRQLIFRHFLTRKHMFLRYASALVVFQGGFGTLDELFEALLLVQTGRVSSFPIVLYGSHFWEGLVSWIRVTLAGEARTIDEHHPDLLTLSDDPHEVVQIVGAAYQRAAQEVQEEPSFYR